LELPVLNTDPPVQPPALYNFSLRFMADIRYNKFVSKTIAKIETILKVILTAKEPPDGLVQNYFFLIADKSVTNFLKILELKVPLSSKVLTTGHPKTRTKRVFRTLQLNHAISIRSRRPITPPNTLIHSPQIGNASTVHFGFPLRHQFE